jgi:hypothetical protein
MTDILIELEDGLTHLANGSGSTCEVSDAVLVRAIKEIKSLRATLRATIDQLRLVVGGVSIESGLTFSDIKRQIRATNG